jgi:HSP20 family molecular chaperone IbpA
MSAFREALRELPDAVFADVLDGDDAYLVVLDVPGAKPETIDLTVEYGILSVKADCLSEPPEGFDSLTENRARELRFEFPVPLDGRGEDASGSLDNGVLELTIPKRNTTSETTIPVTE